MLIAIIAVVINYIALMEAIFITVHREQQASIMATGLVKLGDEGLVSPCVHHSGNFPIGRTFL